jgi:hypothetical protein
MFVGGLSATCVTAACLYVLNSNGTIKSSQCPSNLNCQGSISFSSVSIANDEGFVVQALNNTGAYNYAAWVYAW